MDREEYLEMKKRAVMYYKENQVPQKLEDILNKMYVENPDDIYGYLSEYFMKFAKPPTISQIQCQTSFNRRGHENVTASISCCINGADKRVTELPSLVADSPVTAVVSARMKSAEKASSKNAKKSKKESSVEHISKESLCAKPENNISFERCCKMLEEEFIPLLLGCEIEDQNNIDKILKDAVQEILAECDPTNGAPVPTLILPEEPTASSETIPTDHSVHTIDSEELKSEKPPDRIELQMSSMFLSLVAAVASAQVREESLYKSLIASMVDTEYVGCCLPLPALSAFSCDPSSPGKLMMFQEVFIAPKVTKEPIEGINMVMKFSKHLDQTLLTRYNNHGLVHNASGKRAPPIDKPEQVFDVLMEVATSMEINLDEHFDIVVDVGASNLYDEEKSKYDVILGTPPKTSDNMIDMYKDWLEHYPVVAIINGLAKQDRDNLTKMGAQLSPKCRVYSSDPSETEEGSVLQMVSSETISGVVIQPEKTTSTLTDLFLYAKSLNSNKDFQITISDEWCTLQNNSAVIDLGVALNVSYIFIGPANAFLSLSRLTKICHELYERDELIPRVLQNGGDVEELETTVESTASLAERTIDR